VNGVAETVGLVGAHEPGEKETALIEHGEYRQDKRQDSPGPLPATRFGEHDAAEYGQYDAEEYGRVPGRRVNRVEVRLRRR
jgi:hypothetical protein